MQTSPVAVLFARVRQYSRFLRFLRPQAAVFAVSLTCTAVLGTLSLVNPLLAKYTIDVVFPRRDLPLFLQVIVLSGGVIAITLLLQFLEGMLNLRLDQRLAFDLRRKFYGSLYHLPVGVLRARPVGDVLYRCSTDVDNVRFMLLGTLPNLLLSIVKLSLMLTITLWIHWKLTLLSLAGFPLLYINTVFFSERLRRLRTKGQRAGATGVGFIQESLVGFPLLKAFGRERTTVRRYSGLAAWLSRINATAGYTRLLAGGIGGLLTASWSLGLGLYAGLLVIRREISVGEIVAVGMLLSQLQDPLNRFADIYQRVVVGLVSADRLEELMGQPTERVPRMPTPLPPTPRPVLHGGFELRNVSFGYLPGQLVLNDVSLRIDPRTHVALVGPPGAGKSTLLYLLARFYDPVQGKILLDRKDLRSWNLDDYRSGLAMVLQQPVLFTGTIAENIALGLPRNIKSDAVARCVKRQGIDQLLGRFGLELDQPVGEGGNQLSGGQRQVVALARALVREPAVLLLDEPTSFLDVETEEAVSALLREVARGRTCVTIAHRVATLASSNRIIVLENGVKVQDGTHEELTAGDGFYRRMYDAQFTGWSEVRPGHALPRAEMDR